jgi:site-specific recombinase XerD
MSKAKLVAAQSIPMLPLLIATAGNKASFRFIEFFTVNIRNRNTRAAYARATADFLGWCEGQGIDALGRVQPVHVAAYIELLQGQRAAPAVSQHLACIRMLFDRLVIGQVVPTNSAR